MATKSDNECPYRWNGCKTLYKWEVYCYTKKYFKCIEYQVLRIAKLNRKVKANSEFNEVLKEIKSNAKKPDLNRMENKLIKKIVEKVF